MSTIKNSLTAEERSELEQESPDQQGNVADATQPDESLRQDALEATSERELLELQAEARQEGDADAEEYIQSIIALMRKRLQEGGLYNVKEASAEAELTDEELFEELSEDLGRIIEIEPPGLPKPEKGASDIATFRLEGKAENWEKTRVEDMSGSRYGLGPFIEEANHHDIDLRVCRVEVIEPTDPVTSVEKCKELGIPYPTTDKEAEQAHKIGLGAWQVTAVYRRLKQFMADTGRLQFFTEPMGPSGAWTVTAMDWRLGRSLANNDVGEMHYMNCLTSGAGTFGHDEDHEPDYREPHGKTLTIGELSRITELIANDPFKVGDNIIVDGGTVGIPAPSQEGTDQALELQFRAITEAPRIKEAPDISGLADVFDEASVVKGTIRWYKRSRLWNAIHRYRQQIDALEGEKLDQFLERYQDMAMLLERMLLLSDNRDQAVVLLVKDDQVKISKMADYEGEILFTGTYLRGTYEHKIPFTPDEDAEIRRTPPGGVQDAPEPENLEALVAGGADLVWKNHDERRERFGKNPNRTEELPSYATKNVAHVFTGDSPGHRRSYSMGPTQYRIAANWQLGMFLKPEGLRIIAKHEEECLRELARKLQTPQGVAKLASRRLARQREDIINGKKMKVDQDQDLLSQAVLSGLITSRSGDYVAQLNGKSVKKGKSIAQMLRPIRNRLDRVVIAHINNFILRGMGVRGYGYHHSTCYDSQGLLARKWGSNAGWNKDAADPSAIALPQKVSLKMNADDDGDLTAGIARTVVLASGRVAKVNLIWRYPCVDRPLLVVIPPGMESPFDPQTEEEERRFARIIEAFNPSIPEDEPDVFDDGITMAVAQNAWQLSDQGAKEQFDKQKLQGEITEESAFKFIRRKKDVNSQGSLTRRQERHLELLYKAHVEGKDADHPKIYQDAEEAFAYRSADTMVLIERQLTKFKYQMSGNERTAFGYVLNGGGGDPFGHASDKEVREMVFPLDHHAVVDGKLDCVLGSNETQGETSLEGYIGKPAREDMKGQSRRSQVLRWHFREGGPMREIVDVMTSISIEEEPFRDRIEKKMEANPSSDSYTKPKGADYAQQALQLWRDLWRENRERRIQRVSNAKTESQREEVYEDIAEERTFQSRGLRALMREVGNEISIEALRAAIYHDLEPPEDKEGNEGRTRTSSAAALAMMDDRVGEVLPLVGAQYEPPKNDGKTAVVFSRGQDILGPIAPEVLMPVDGNSAFRKQESADNYEGLFVREDDEKIRLFADEKPADVLQGPCKLVAVSRRRAVLMKR